MTNKSNSQTEMLSGIGCHEKRLPTCVWNVSAAAAVFTVLQCIARREHRDSVIERESERAKEEYETKTSVKINYGHNVSFTTMVHLDFFLLFPFDLCTRNALEKR